MVCNWYVYGLPLACLAFVVVCIWSFGMYGSAYDLYGSVLASSCSVFGMCWSVYGLRFVCIGLSMVGFCSWSGFGPFLFV